MQNQIKMLHKMSTEQRVMAKQLFISPDKLMFWLPCLLLHRESKKGATLTMAITLSVLGGFQNFCTAAKSTKFPTKLILVYVYPPHLTYIVALPWKI